MSTQTLQIEARIENLPAIIRFATDCVAKLDWAENRLTAIELVVEEAVVNVCKYAYHNECGMIEISCEMAKSFLRIGITDTGVPFDLLSVTEPDLGADIAERQIGGVGCFLIRSLTDDVTYRREGDRNVLELSFFPTKREGHLNP
ncbi:MAG: ATP-binding protein [Geobacteraceae bacterium]|nr:ATP-binding protein [Geobacteraceae bacterium]